MDSCWPSLAWRLNSTAAHLCRLGLFDRADEGSSSSSSSIDNKNSSHTAAWVKVKLFWQVYTMDKCLSLRLGCVSALPNAFVDPEAPARYGLYGDGKLQQVSLPKLWVTTSSLRARVHEQMLVYSPSFLFLYRFSPRTMAHCYCLSLATPGKQWQHRQVTASKEPSPWQSNARLSRRISWQPKTQRSTPWGLPALPSWSSFLL